MTIKHIVMWRVRGDSADERRANAQRVQAAFEPIAGRIPGLRKLEIGIDESGLDYACHVVLYSEFVDQASLDAYTTHPEHQRAKDLCGDVRITRHVVDYTVQD